ncbi:hypothetical protein [Streptococcus cristatus]|uniref:hypothetical protein n=1 Tax=Streptococcus cristatus TaxID=45634 RepID=UPI002284F158|nr:hypothetical protein [Streptococcus cristatus]MCY7217434.1 hypothetical protein [Streptococcus cristatus]
MKQHYFNLISKNKISPKTALENIEDVINQKISNLDISLNDIISLHFKCYGNNEKFSSFSRLQDYINSQSKTLTEKLFYSIEMYSDIIYSFDYPEIYPDSNKLSELNNQLDFFTKISKGILEDFNHEIVKSDGNYIICEKNVNSGRVAEILGEDNETEAMLIIEYNHFSNLHNLQRKREILRTLANYMEETKEETISDLISLFSSSTTKIKVIDELFMKFNNLSIRHQNEKQITSQFTAGQLEKIYDDIYTTVLFLILSREQVVIHENFEKDIKSKCKK